MKHSQVTSAVQTPPHLLFQFMEEYKSKFKRLEYFISFLKNHRETEAEVEDITGHGWIYPVQYLPSEMRSLVNNMGRDSVYNEPLSRRIQELQEYSKLQLSRDTINSVLKRMINLETDRSEYKSFNERYFSFIKDYQENLAYLHEQADPEEALYNKEISQNYQAYRTALDAVYKYISLYLKFATKIQALQVRRQMSEKAYYGGESERKMRPPIKDVEILFHASARVPVILREGFKTRDELGEGTAGLGGGPSDVVSFTADIDIAKGTVDAVRDIVKIAHGELSLEQVIKMAEAEGIDTKEYQPDRLKYNYGSDRSVKDLTYEAYKNYLWFNSKRYNPVFIGTRIAYFEDMKLEDIGIIASRVDMKQVTEYLKGEEEFRVPTSAILSMKRVLY